MTGHSPRPKWRDEAQNQKQVKWPIALLVELRQQKLENLRNTKDTEKSNNQTWNQHQAFRAGSRFRIERQFVSWRSYVPIKELADLPSEHRMGTRVTWPPKMFPPKTAATHESTRYLPCPPPILQRDERCPKETPIPINIDVDTGRCGSILSCVNSVVFFVCSRYMAELPPFGRQRHVSTTALHDGDADLTHHD